MERKELQDKPQKLTLDDRRHLTLTGVEEVESFDENAVVLDTNLGTLVVRGRELRLRQLSVDGGQVAVDGQVDALLYEEKRQKGGFFARLLG